MQNLLSTEKTLVLKQGILVLMYKTSGFWSNRNISNIIIYKRWGFISFRYKA